MMVRAVVAAAILATAILPAGCSAGVDATAAAQAFAVAAGDPARSVRVHAAGRFSAPFSAEFSGTYDLAGPDFVGSTVLTSEGMEAGQGLARLGDLMFSSYGDNPWGLEDRIFARPDPFAGIGIEDIEVVGTERLDDRDVVRLRVLEAEAALGVIAIYGSHFLTTTRIDRFTFDLYVNPDGAPVSANVAVGGVVSGELAGPVSAEFALRFSGWGSTALEPPFVLATFPPGTNFVAVNGFDEPIIVRDGRGTDLLVPACSRVTTDSFEGNRIDVRFAVDDELILSSEPIQGDAHLYLFASALSTSLGDELPYIETAKAPCTDRRG